VSSREKKRVLIVDDQPEIRRLAGFAFTAPEVCLFHAEDGSGAIEEARRKKPDLVVLDVMMPEKDGFEVARILKDDPATSSCKIIIMTAKSGENERAVALDSGADDFVNKPFRISELREKGKKLLGEPDGWD